MNRDRNMLQYTTHLRVVMVAAAIFFAVAEIATCVAPARGAEKTNAAMALVKQERVLVIAHRGDSAACPENTLPAFESAVRTGADLVELDYHHSSDGVPVVMHDFTLDRTTDAAERLGKKGLKLVDFPAAELTALDAGRWFGKGAFHDVHVPTLEASLEVIQNGSVTLVERKAGDAATCVALLRRLNLIDQVVVQSFDWKYVADCHKLEPALMLAALGHGAIDAQRIEALRATGAQIVAWHHKELNAEVIGRIHDAGFRAWSFTVDDLDRAEELVDAGIDGIITNVPARVRERVAEASATP